MERTSTVNQEALRCLLCKVPKCSAACPVGTKVPLAMGLYREGRMQEAGKALFANNPFSAITSIVCDWDRFCLGHCVLNARRQPVRWHEIEEEVSGEYLRTARLSVAPDTGRSVAIVGAGPAGMTAAMLLRERGLRVTLYDDNPMPGGVLRYGIPAFRLRKELVDAYSRIMAEAGIDFWGGCKVGRDLTLDQLRGGADAVLIASGACNPRRLDIPGEDDPRVIYALDYLKDPDAYHLRGKVLVIGGGNVTMDASRTALRKGCDTTVYYRKTFANMPANDGEVREALAEGVKFRLFRVPVAIRGGVAIMRACENYVTDEGKLRTRMLAGRDYGEPFDHMIVAISETVSHDVTGGLAVDDLPEGVFVAGDFMTGPRTVVEAVATAKTAVGGILDYLKIA